MLKLSANCFGIVLGKKCKISIILVVLKRSLFSPPLGLLGAPDHILQNICLKPWRGFIFGPYAHFLLMKS